MSQRFIYIYTLPESEGKPLDMAKFCTQQRAVQFTPIFPMEKQPQNRLFTPFRLEQFMVRPTGPDL